MRICALLFLCIAAAGAMACSSRWCRYRTGCEVRGDGASDGVVTDADASPGEAGLDSSPSCGAPGDNTFDEIDAGEDCSVTLDGGVLVARIPSGLDYQDRAFVTRAVPASDGGGMWYFHDQFFLPTNQTLRDSLVFVRLGDDDAGGLEIFLRNDLTLWLFAGAPDAGGAVPTEAGVATNQWHTVELTVVTNATRVLSASLTFDSVPTNVTVDNVGLIRWVHVGIDHYDGVIPNDPVEVRHHGFNFAPNRPPAPPCPLDAGGS
jgi:hypothetical protein